jgi:ssRNA-specific RNase YbeY (16S rRNA maturation enzyme)
MIDVSVTFEQRLGAIGTRLFRECTETVVQHARRRKAAVSFVILSDPEMREINRKFSATTTTPM